MSLNQDRLTDSEKKHFRKTTNTAIYQGELVEKHTRIAAQMAEDAQEEIVKAHKAQSAKKKAKHIDEAQKKFAKAASEAQTSSIHSRSAEVSLIATKTAIEDRLDGFPQYMKFPLSKKSKKTFLFKRVGEMYNTRQEAVKKKNKLFLKNHGPSVKIHRIPSGRFKGNYLIYVLDERISPRQAKMYGIPH